MKMYQQLLILMVILVVMAISSNHNIIYVSASQYCNPIKCVDYMNGCGTNGQICKNDRFCQYNYDKPICLDRFAEFETCDSDNVCLSGTVCFHGFGDDYYCRNAYFLGSGEVCRNLNESIDCSTGLSCVGGICANPDGSGQCKNDMMCPYGFFCDSTFTNSNMTLCSKKLANGMECSADNQCMVGSVCSVNAAAKTICRPIYSVGEGEPCSHPKACDLASSLVCSNNGYCIQYDDRSDSGLTCGNGTAVCYGGVESCVCNSLVDPTGECKQVTKVNSDCKRATIDYYNCIKEYNCPEVVNSKSGSSCKTKKCSGQYQEYIDQCTNPDYTCQFPSAGHTIIVNNASHLIFTVLISLSLIIVLL